MNKRRMILNTAAAAGLLFLAVGCGTAPDAGGKPVSSIAAGQQSDESARKMLEAFLSNDARKFVGILPPEMREQFGVKEFENARTSLTETLGRPVSYQFATTLEHPLLNVSIWKVRFERRGSEGEMIRQEALFRLISGTLDGQSRVISFNFL